MPLDHDAIFKQLIGAFLGEFLDLFAPNLAAMVAPASLTLLPTESFVSLLDPDRRTADLLVQAELRAQPATILIHLEHQAQADRQLDRRMFRYFARFYDHYNQPIYPLALCSYRSPRRAAPHAHQLSVAQRPVLDFQYQVVQLNQLDWRAYLRHPNPLAAALMARMRMAPNERWQVKAACLRQLAGLPLSKAQQHMLATFVSIYLPLQGQEAAHFAAEVATWQAETQEVVVELINEWELKGLKKGRKEGRKEGRLEGQQELLQQQLTHRFGTLPDPVQRRLLTLSARQLSALGEAIFDLQHLADLEAWLAATPERA
jgi:predicted transposase YdaD